MNNNGTANNHENCDFWGDSTNTDATDMVGFQLYVRTSDGKRQFFKQHPGKGWRLYTGK